MIEGVYRTRADTAAGAFSTLLVMIPWKVLEAYGMDETQAASVAGGLLLVLSVAAFAAHRHVRAEFALSIYGGEKFSWSNYLRDFAMFAWAMMTLVALLATMLHFSLQGDL